MSGKNDTTDNVDVQKSMGSGCGLLVAGLVIILFGFIIIFFFNVNNGPNVIGAVLALLGGIISIYSVFSMKKNADKGVEQQQNNEKNVDNTLEKF